MIFNSIIDRLKRKIYRYGANDVMQAIISQKKEKMVVIYEDDLNFYTFTAKKHKK